MPRRYYFDEDCQSGALAVALRQHGVEVLTETVDVRHEDAVDALAAATVERFGTVNVVCNNAGVSSRSDPWLGPLATWKWVFDVNVMGVVHGVLRL